MATDMIINGKSIYTPKGAALEYGRVGCNFYTGCPHDCEYCYLKRGAPSKQLGGTEVRLKKCFKDETDALEVFCKEVRKHLDHLKETGIFFSFTTDPMIPETIDLTLSAWNMCIYNDIPVKVLTKDASFVDHRRMLLNYKSNAVRDLVHFGFTLTGRDDMEPRASSNADRIKAMQRLHDMGFKTWASIEPVVDWKSSSKMVLDTLGCCDHYKIGLRSGVKRDYYDFKETVDMVNSLTVAIRNAGRTVYLKQSIRNLFGNTLPLYDWHSILSRTVDMDGKEWNNLYI